MVTTNDLENARQTCYSIYEKYQSTMAGNLDGDTDKLESEFNEIACEMGVEYSDLWEEFENEHEGMIAWNGS